MPRDSNPSSAPVYALCRAHAAIAKRGHCQAWKLPEWRSGFSPMRCAKGIS